MKRIWKAKPKIDGDLRAQLLANRGILDAAEAEKFLNPRYEDSHDPFLMKDMDRAVARISAAMEGGEKITVYADYDADGVTAAAVLLRFFQHLNYPGVDYYIPDRFEESYGVNVEAVETLARRGTKLLITVDCGINAFDSVAKARELGVDVIVTDHHQLTGGIPEAVAVLNPHRPDDSYPFKDLTGVGVAFKLVQALQSVIASAQRARGNLDGIASSSPPPEADVTSRNDRIVPGFEKWLLDLVAIGTVADCQSLLGENRIIVKWGLLVLQKTRWVGLRKLLERAGIREAEMDTYKIGFVIAPRINAAGRIEHANLALELLMTDDEAYATELAEKLEDLNHHRQELTEQILSEAREQLVLMADKKILLAAGEGWPKGVVGLVAGKLTEEFARPVLILERGELEATGSARSIGNFNIIEAIGQSQEILMRYGGHPMAAGFTLKSEHIGLFHRNLLQYAEGLLSEEDLAPVVEYDAEIAVGQINDRLLEDLRKLGPFGLGNPRPRFRINNVSPRYVSTVGNEGKHLRMYLGDAGQSFGCIGFNLGFWAQKISDDRKIDILCEPQYNEWNGNKKIQLKIFDLHSTDEE